MKPLPEESRFPTLNIILTSIISFLPALTVACLTFMRLLPTEQTTNLFARIEQLIKPYSISFIVLIAGTVIITNIAIFTINHLSGRNHFSDKAPAHSMFAEAYAISSAYVLPYAYHSTNKHGEHFCDLYLSFSYAEILHVYQTLMKRHQLTYYFRTLSLPSHLGRRMPLLTRAGAKQLLNDMVSTATANGEDVQSQRTVLLYTFYPHYSNSADLPTHQAFISRDIIRELLYLINPDPDHIISKRFEIEAFYDSENVITLSTTYLHATYARIAAEDELVYLPISTI